jgi:hypothetical protein
MNQVYGRKETLAYAKNAKPGDQTVIVNWDLISEIPDQYEVKIVDVEFDPKNISAFFTNVGTEKNPKWYPHIDFMYKIAEARGVSGSDVEATILYEDVEIDEINMTETGQIVRKKVGYEVKKSSTVLEEDGTLRGSGERISMENAWETCVKAWHKEEKATQGYSPEIVKNGEFTYYKKKCTGAHYYVQSGQYSNATPLKYDTKWKRRCHFDEELSKALGKADSKVKSKCIREIVGLPTAFESHELQRGKITVTRVIRSRKILQAEAAANLSSMANGNQPQLESQEILFGSQEEKETTSPIQPSAQVKVPEPQTRYDQALEVLGFYISEKLMPDNAIAAAQETLDWLNNNPNAESSQYWGNVTNRIKSIESQVAQDFRKNHSIY